MKKLYIVVFLFCCFFHVALLEASQAVVKGQLISKNTNYPAPGLTVSLIHPNLGRSAPAVSDGNGVFTFYGIPLMQTQYFLEVYWGRQLIFRKPIWVNNTRVSLPPFYI